MKITGLFILLLTPFFLMAQEPLKFEQVVEVDSLNANDLYNNAHRWIADNFKYPGVVVKIDNKEEKEISIQSNFAYNRPGASKGTIEFKLDLFFKDGRYKYVFSDFIHRGSIDFGVITDNPEQPRPGAGKKWKKAAWADMKATVAEFSENTATDIHAQMTTIQGAW